MSTSSLTFALSSCRAASISSASEYCGVDFRPVPIKKSRRAGHGQQGNNGYKYKLGNSSHCLFEIFSVPFVKHFVFSVLRKRLKHKGTKDRTKNTKKIYSSFTSNISAFRLPFANLMFSFSPTSTAPASLTISPDRFCVIEYPRFMTDKGESASSEAIPDS